MAPCKPLLLVTFVAPALAERLVVLVIAFSSLFRYVEDKVVVVIMAGTRENFYDELKRYMK